MPAKSIRPKNKAPKTSIVIEEEKYTCSFCAKLKVKSAFYVSSNPLVKTGVTCICKECAEKLARNYSEDTGRWGDVTKSSLQEALEYLDKPYLEDIWETSVNEVHSADNNSKQKNVWGAYVKNIGMKQYRNKRWRDGDLFATHLGAKIRKTTVSDVETDETPKNQELWDEFQKNKSDVIRLLGYDPFENELPSDQPLLYSQLIGYLDLGGDNDDMMRTSSAITIVRGFLQQSKVDDAIAKITSDPFLLESKAGALKNFMDMKQKNSSFVSQLAEQNCLSLKYNKNASKGENTWTGKIKKIKELNLREGEINGFDMATCKGMQQVMDLSNQSILKALHMDESEYSDLIADQRVLVTKTTAERDKYREISRILLRENLDLKGVLEEHDLLDKDNLIDLENIFSPFSEQEYTKDDAPTEESNSLGGASKDV